MKRTKSADKQILNRIYGHGRGWVFTPDSFKDLGSRDAIAFVANRWANAGLAVGLRQNAVRDVLWRRTSL